MERDDLTDGRDDDLSGPDDGADVLARAEEVVRHALAAQQGPFALTGTDELLDSVERDLDELEHSGSLAYPLLADIDARLTAAIARAHRPGSTRADDTAADHAAGLLELLGDRRDQMCELESEPQFQLKAATGLLAIDELPVGRRPARHVPSFADDHRERFEDFRDRLLADDDPAGEPERTWAARARKVLDRTDGPMRAALCLDWYDIALDTSDWAAHLAASVLGRYGTIVSFASPNDAICLAPPAPARFLAATTLGRNTVLLTDGDDPAEVIPTLLSIAVNPQRRTALVTHADGQLGIWRSANMCHAAPG